MQLIYVVVSSVVSAKCMSCYMSLPLSASLNVNQTSENLESIRTHIPINLFIEADFSFTS